jgi:hypothetical protein
MKMDIVDIPIVTVWAFSGIVALSKVPTIKAKLIVISGAIMITGVVWLI